MSRNQWEEQTMANGFRICFLSMGLIAAGLTASPSAGAKEWGEEWADWCLQNAASPSIVREEQCCRERHDAHPVCSPDADPKQAACIQGLVACRHIISCNKQLDECKTREMETDKDCSGDKCKQCTEDYKVCHDEWAR
jgi:hypothetical protein